MGAVITFSQLQGRRRDLRRFSLMRRSAVRMLRR
jgi:hypothetical protein